MPERYRCPACGTINSAYHVKCRTCGREPASEFGAAHRQEILDRVKAQTQSETA